jgi:serine/threonine-protein kinase
VNFTPAWSSDGDRLAFLSNREGPWYIFWQLADGSGDVERLTNSDFQEAPSSFSRDGQRLAYIEANPESGRDIWVLDLAERKAEVFLQTPNEETAPAFSPDGKWIAYSSDETGRREVYVRPYPGPGGELQISTDGGQEPVWNPKGGELFYRSGNRMMAVVMDTDTGMPEETPQMLFEGDYLPTAFSFPYYDVSPDGERFLMLQPIESQTRGATEINVVLNWFEELQRLVPTE